MTQKKKLRLNTYVALLYQVVTVICGFILPRIIIPAFGSATNGLINSITQFLTVITLCECGVGSVVQSALYKPLAEGDNYCISKILISSKRFFNRVMGLFVVYILVLIIAFPTIINGDYGFGTVYTVSMVIILSISYIAQYYLFLTYRLLLNADQASYIQLGVHCVQLILNTLVTVVLVYLGVGIHLVKLISAAIFFVQPIFLKIYVDKHYSINWKITLTEEPIKQKWNGMAQHIASVVLGNTDTVVLTMFSSLENVSVYGVYYLVVHGIRQVVVSFSTGIQSLLGNILAKNERNLLEDLFSKIEIVFHFLVSYLFLLTGVLILPFVKIYTNDFSDTSYYYPLFGILMVIAQATYCYRIPYETMIRAAGHYKETQKSSIIEAMLNLGVSILLVAFLPENRKLVGVAIGTIIAMAYRTSYLVLYLKHNILFKTIRSFMKHVFTDIVAIICSGIVSWYLPQNSNSYLGWGISAFINGVVVLIIFIILYFFSYGKDVYRSFKLFIR